MRYGPYKVPNMGKKNPLGEAGSLWNHADNVVKKPCDQCVIVGMNAGLEYPDGTNANINTGMWLHHMVLFSIGPGRTDATCGQNGMALPHFLVGSSARGAERLLASGNERTFINFPGWGYNNAGYKLKSQDKFALIVDLMNENMEDKLVYMTLTYDFVPGNGTGFRDVKPVWFDVAQCLTSEVWPPKQNGQFTLTAPTWTANFDGEIIGMAGHVHDGGQLVTLEVDGQPICRSQASYGGDPQFVAGKALSHHGSATEHVSKMSICVNESLGIKRVSKGQRWILKADYDYDKSKGMLHDNGRQENIMGIAIMFAMTS